MYVYRYFKEAGCYTVGFYSPKGEWESESDHESPEKAAARVAWLNGDEPKEEPMEESAFILHGTKLERACQKVQSGERR